MALDMEHESGWQTMESGTQSAPLACIGLSQFSPDPGVFSELLSSLGVPLIVDDLYSLDTESLAALAPLHALIFLFKWTGSSDETGGGQGTFDYDFPGFFANQVRSSSFPPLICRFHNTPCAWH